MANLTASVALNMELNGNALLVAASTPAPERSGSVIVAWTTSKFEPQWVRWTCDGSSDVNMVDEFARYSSGDNSTIFQISGFSLSVEHVNEVQADHPDDAEASYVLMQEILSGNDTITGSVGNDRLYGFSGNDLIDGGSGSDILAGGTGNDTYVYTSGDTIVEAAGADIDTVKSAVTFTLGNYLENLTLTGSAVINGTGNSLNNVITGNSGNNALNGLTGSDTLIGGTGNDTYISDGGDTVTEALGAGTDIVQSSASFTLGSNVENLMLTGTGTINGTGNSGNNSITGNSGNNILDGLTGTDTLAGGTGNDTYVTDGGDTISEASGAGTDLVKSSVTYTLGSNLENLTLTGTGTINGTGNSLNNTITGNSGSNTLNGGTGTDTLIGGGGNDTYIINDADTISETSGAGTDTVNANISFTLGSNIENLTLTGSGNINATGNSGNNTLTGNAGDNILNGVTGTDKLIGGTGDDTYIVNGGDTITEGAGAGIDTVKSSVSFVLGSTLEKLTLTGSDAINGTGNALNNTLTGNAANNTLQGGAGNDKLIGGAGSDTYIVNGGDTITEAAGQGNDTVQSNISYTLGSNLEKLTLTGSDDIDGTGNSLSNTITGNSGDNILFGDLGSDILLGGSGSDTYIVNGGDTVTEALGAGIDTVQAKISYTLGSNLENLTLTGTSAIDGTGNSIKNTIIGNESDNVLNGGLGNDTLNGGLGNDSYRFDSVLNASTNVDTISFFSVTDDSIELDNAIFASLVTPGALSANNFSNTGTAADADDYIVYNAATGQLLYDADGNGAGAAVQFALLGTSTHPAVTAADFVVI